jgi:tRNA (cmo5U34)-methyltransferase
MPRSRTLGSSRQEFDREAATYDSEVASTMPGYSELHQMLVWGVPYLPTRSFRILELGVGTGTLTALLLESFPHATVRGIDISPRMIAASRAKLRPWKDRVELRTGDLDDVDPDEKFDAVVSALAIHHLSHAKKRRLFGRLFDALPPGGYFGDGDDHLPEDPTFDARFAQIAASIPPPAGSRGRSGRSPQRVWHEHEKFDHPWGVTDELAGLRSAGFLHVGVPWQFFAQTVVWAYR